MATPFTKDQARTRGNLALCNAEAQGTPVRWFYQTKEAKEAYVYGGLWKVTSHSFRLQTEGDARRRVEVTLPKA